MIGRARIARSMKTYDVKSSIEWSTGLSPRDTRKVCKLGVLAPAVDSILLVLMVLVRFDQKC